MEHLSYEMKVLNIYDKVGNDELHRYNPTHQIPCLMDDNRPVWDSRFILQYLTKKHVWTPLTLDDENRLTAIDSMIEAGVVLMLMKKSEIPLKGMYPERMMARIDSIHEWLKSWMNTSAAHEWNHVTQTLYTAYDWLAFREIHAVAQSPEAKAFLAIHAQRSVIQLTDPRKG